MSRIPLVLVGFTPQCPNGLQESYGQILVSGVLGEVSSLAFGESEQRISGGGTPNDAQKPTHTQSLRDSFFQAIGATREALIAAHSAHPPAFLSFCSSFLSLCLSPAFHKEISLLDGLETTIANSVDDYILGFVSPHAHFPFPKVDRCRHLIVPKEILSFSDLRCTASPAVSSASSHRQQFRSESRLVDQDSQGCEFCACGTRMTDVSLPIFEVEVQKRRIQMIDAKAASN